MTTYLNAFVSTHLICITTTVLFHTKLWSHRLLTFCVIIINKQTLGFDCWIHFLVTCDGPLTSYFIFNTHAKIANGKHTRPYVPLLTPLLYFALATRLPGTINCSSVLSVAIKAQFSDVHGLRFNYP